MVAPGDGRQQRSAETKRSLLRFGGAVFAERGYDATTTRMLADAAGVNQAAILYHFGGKEGLYVAVATEIATRGRQAMRPYLSSTCKPIGSLSTVAAREELGRFLRGLLRGLITVAGDGSAAAFIVREQANPGPAFDRLFEAYIQPVHAHVTALVAAARKSSKDNTDAVLTAHAIIGMALAFVTARETALRRAKWPAYTAERIEQIADVVVGLADGALESGAQRPGRRRGMR